MLKLTPFDSSPLSERQLPVRRTLQTLTHRPVRPQRLGSLRSGPSLLALTALIGLVACGGPVEFDLNENVSEQRVVGNPAGGALTTFLPTPVVLKVNVQQAAMAANAKGPLSTVVLTGMQFHVTAPETSPTSFDFVQTADVYIESTRPNSSLAPALVASLAAPPGKTVAVTMIPLSTVNLLSFLGEGARFTTKATGTVPAQDVTFTGSFTLHGRTTL